MPASPPPTATEPVSAPTEVHRSQHFWLWPVAGLTAAWVIFLTAITWQTANPPVVNVVQISHSDFILVGRWQDRNHGKFNASQELKQGDPLGVVRVTGVPDRGMPSAAEWVIPVTKLGGNYAVTQGRFQNVPQHPQPNVPRQNWQVDVHPQCYPATADVIQQIQAALSVERPLPKP